MTTIDDDQMRRITSLLIDGLNAEEAEHKQFALEYALRELVPDEFDACKADWNWADGVDPE